MKRSIKLLSGAIAISSAFAMSGCIDDAYDLENINTDVEVKVNDLVVPVNLDKISLSSVFDLDPESVIKEVNGEYAVVVSGNFKSNSITVNPIDINPGIINPIVCQIFKYAGSDVNLPVAAQTISYEITPAATAFTFSSANVDKSIRSIGKIKGEWNINVDMILSDQNGLFEYLNMQRLVLQIPSGLHVSNYNSNNGEVTFNNLTMNIGKVTTVTLKIDEIDFSKFDATTFRFTPASGSINNGVIDFNGSIGVKSGLVVGGTDKTSTALPQNVTLNITPRLDRIHVTSVSGTISYNINDFSVPDITLSDLPDMLHQDGTDISIANPQLYISMNNPVANYGLKGSSGLTLISKKENDEDKEYILDEQIVLGSDKGIVGPYEYCLSPKQPAHYYDNYSGASWLKYTTLSNLLSGNGLPDYISVSFDNPRVLPGQVTDFKLETIDPVEGSYTLYAPLELTVGSKIVYENEDAGWGDETLEKLTVTTLKVNASITNNLPVDITLSGVPLGADGKQCVDPKTKKPVKLEEIKVSAGKTSDIELKTTGTIVGIDGIRYTAKCHVAKEGQSLRPAETIDIKDIRVTVGGYYRDTL